MRERQSSRDRGGETQSKRRGNRGRRREETDGVGVGRAVERDAEIERQAERERDGEKQREKESGEQA